MLDRLGDEPQNIANLQQEAEDLLGKVWQENLPDAEDFSSKPLDKQVAMLKKVLDNPSKVLLLLNRILYGNSFPNFVPENWIKFLNIENISEILRAYFPDVLLVWLSALPTEKIEEICQSNAKIREFWEEKSAIFRREMAQIKESIEKQQYIPPDITEQTPKKREELEELAKKIDTSEKVWKDESLYIQNAGMVLLHPYFMRLFTVMDLVENGAFKSDWEASKAVYILEYLVRKDYEGIDEANLVLNKLLCGIPLERALWKEVEISEKEKEICEGLLQAVIQTWTALGKSSPDALRYGFLQREGRLTQEAPNWRLRVEQQAMDILVESLPWTIGMVKTPLMKGFVYTEWT